MSEGTTKPRLEKAEGILRAAEANTRDGLWDSAVSRAYYAGFHAVVCYLQEKHAGTPARHGRWGHDYVVRKFRQRAGSPEGMFFRRLYQARTVADYHMTVLAERDAKIAVDLAQKIIEFVKKSVGSPTTASGSVGVP